MRMAERDDSAAHTAMDTYAVKIGNRVCGVYVCVCVWWHSIRSLCLPDSLNHIHLPFLTHPPHPHALALTTSIVSWSGGGHDRPIVPGWAK